MLSLARRGTATAKLQLTMQGPTSHIFAVRYLSFDLSDATDGITTLDALAATSAAQHPAVLAEVNRVLDWAWRHFPHSHGPVEEGQDWDHELQVQIGPEAQGHWHEVALTLTGSAAFVAEFLAEFGPANAPD
jgi:hypothetical protein